MLGLAYAEESMMTF